MKMLAWTMQDEIRIKIGAKVVRHGRYVAFQLAEVAGFTDQVQHRS